MGCTSSRPGPKGRRALTGPVDAAGGPGAPSSCPAQLQRPTRLGFQPLDDVASAAVGVPGPPLSAPAQLQGGPPAEAFFAEADRLPPAPSSARTERDGPGRRRPRPCLALGVESAQDVSEILEFLLVGAENSSRNLSLLRERNIKVVINATTDDWPVARLENIRYVQLNWKDDTAQRILPDLATAFECIEEARRQGGRCLVYCKSGMSRSGSIALAYLLAYRDMTLIDALAFCRARRPIVSPNAGFMTQLAELEEEKRGRVTVDLLKYEENRFGEPTTLACAA